MGEKLFEEWRVYEKLLTHDYMDHKAFFGRLREELERRFKRPIRILDLGCGDLTPLLPILQNIPIEYYLGIDESDGALAIARERLASLSFPSQLVKGDLLESIKQTDSSFDVIVASFSLHHLVDPADKQSTLEAIGERLSSDGFFALIDVFCKESEPRQEYLERWIAQATERYAELLPEEKALLFDHVRKRDHPVSQLQWKSMAEQSGLSDFRVLLYDHAQLNGIAVFQRGNH